MKEEVSKYLNKAELHLNDARLLLAANSINGAINRAYYAMFEREVAQPFRFTGVRNFWIHSGSVKWNRLPFPGSDSTQIRPPRPSTIFLHSARPMPVPVSSGSRSSRSKRLKIRS